LRALGLLALVVALACSAPPGELKLDTEAYLARMSSWAPVEAETNRTLERILVTQFVDESEVRRQIADSRPRILAHLERIRAYAPRTDAVRRIHMAYVAAWERLLSGYDAIESGFESGDNSRLARGRQAIEGWQAAIIAVARDLSELTRRVGASPERATAT
jgi:hypothetical protein